MYCCQVVLKFGLSRGQISTGLRLYRGQISTGQRNLQRPTSIRLLWKMFNRHWLVVIFPFYQSSQQLTAYHSSSRGDKCMLLFVCFSWRKNVIRWHQLRLWLLLAEVSGCSLTLEKEKPSTKLTLKNGGSKVNTFGFILQGYPLEVVLKKFINPTEPLQLIHLKWVKIHRRQSRINHSYFLLSTAYAHAKGGVCGVLT